MTAAGRLWIGGAGALVGVLVIVLSRCSGWPTVRRVRKGGWTRPVAADLRAGAASGRTGPFQWLAPDVTQRINATLALPMLLVFTPATAVLGMLLHDVEDRQATDQALKDSSARLRAIATALPGDAAGARRRRPLCRCVVLERCSAAGARRPAARATAA